MLVLFSPPGAHPWKDRPALRSRSAKGIIAEFEKAEYVVADVEALPAKPIPAAAASRHIPKDGSARLPENSLDVCAEAPAPKVRRQTARSISLDSIFLISSR